MNVLNIFRSAMYFVSGKIAPEHRVHAEFLYDGDGWSYNRHMHDRKQSTPSTETLKIRILLNESDLNKLDDCPYMAKLAPSINSDIPFKYCAFLYPRPNIESITELTEWVEARSFANASVFTYGHIDRVTLQWVPGTKVRKLRAKTSTLPGPSLLGPTFSTTAYSIVGEPQPKKLHFYGDQNGTSDADSNDTGGQESRERSIGRDFTPRPSAREPDVSTKTKPAARTLKFFGDNPLPPPPDLLQPQLLDIADASAEPRPLERKLTFFEDRYPQRKALGFDVSR